MKGTIDKRPNLDSNMLLARRVVHSRALEQGRVWPLEVGGGVRIHPENARMSGRHGVQYVAQCVACAALTPVVWQYITNLSGL